MSTPSPASLSLRPPFGPRVAVIGAGISGTCSAAYLLKEGLSVTVFERSSVVGGVWHLGETTSIDPPYPNETPSLGDYQVSVPGQYAYRTPPPDGPEQDGTKAIPQVLDDNEQLEVLFSPPGPCYPGLKNNVPISLSISALETWPDATEEVTSWRTIEKYIQSLAKNHGVEDATLFSTRVDDVRRTPDEKGWIIRAVTLEKDRAGVPRLAENLFEFDAVVVASGHYNMPRIPEIEGLASWKAAFPDRVNHSKRYRDPERYRDQNILLIGAGVSSIDISRELDGIANNVFQSSRGGPFDLSASMLPANGSRVAGVERFILDSAATWAQQDHPDEQPIPGKVVLKDGRILEDIHQVIVATGYIASYPFLPQLHSDTLSMTEAGPDLIITSEGTMTHNLHKDIFYIPEPSLAFVGIPFHVATFSCFDFQAQVVARAFAGRVKLPSRVEMRAEYETRLREKGAGRGFHSLRGPGSEIDYVNDLLAWVNGFAEAAAVTPLKGHSEKWIAGYWAMREKMKALLNLDR